MVVNRGDVWWADFGQPRGAEPGFVRPVIVVQADPLNESALSTIMVVPLTSNLRRAEAIGNIQLGTKDTGLDKISVALTCQVFAIDRDWLLEQVGSLPDRALRRLNEGLKVVLALD